LSCDFLCQKENYLIPFSAKFLYGALMESDAYFDETDGETLQLTLAEGGARADKAIAEALPSLSRSRVQALISQGCIQWADGRTLDSSSTKIPAGSALILHLPPVEEMNLTPENIPLEIVYEDVDLLVVNKPAGMSVHPAPGSMHGTLVHALLHHCGDSLSGIGGVARPGIVHRIDKDTTGLLVVAKHDEAHKHLSAQLADRSLSRRYAALVWGQPPQAEGTIDAPIARHPKLRQQMAIVQGGKQAITHYQLRESFYGRASLVECRLETGRTHQIRVHMKHLGHPLLGDTTYGGKIPHKTPESILTALNAFPRQALHAFQLTLTHPRLGKKLRCEAPLPADMQALMAALRQNG
jgi:23S rRNA pseudouridine1911/1915/1917 synthase